MSLTSEVTAQHNGILKNLNSFVLNSLTGDEKETTSPNGATTTSFLNSVVHDFASQERRIPEDIGLIMSSIQTQLDGGLIDDKTYLIERIIQLASSLPNASKAGSLLTGTLVKNLWSNLQHPPVSYLGEKFKYRTADGSNNNVTYPELGKAGSYYARTVTPVTQLPPVLPDPGLIFDSLFVRSGPAKEHPNKISSMLFYLAIIIIHDLFRTNDRDSNRVDASSYLDLSPLYGSNEIQQSAVRTFRDGRLKNDAFSEIRILGFPPGVCALLVTFNRFHNYVVGELAEINETGRFSLPSGIDSSQKDLYDAALRKRDNELFQTGRLVTCGLYANIILGDYVRTILNLNRSNSTWGLDPRKTFEMTNIPSATGNQVSVEFNLIYRWHAAVSSRDDQWSQGFYKELFPNVDPSELSLPDFIKGLRVWQMAIPSDPGQRSFGGLTRNPNGAFEDSALVNFLTESTEDVAGAFGARNVPAILRAVDILGIEQARSWKVATLNEFRKFFGLKPYSEFSDINSDPAVAASLEALYVQPDHVELYPGLVAEEAKQVRNVGQGLCPGYTVSKTILSDAVALVRGDRFYTVDYTPTSLTNWGYNEVSAEPQVAGGGVIYKLLMRAFPGYYRANSVYAMFPFTIPSENRYILQTLGKEQDYDFSRPSFIGQPQLVTTWSGVRGVLDDLIQPKAPWGLHNKVVRENGYMVNGEAPENSAKRSFAHHAMYEGTNNLDEIRHFYETITSKLVRENSLKLRNSHQLDAVRDVGNKSHANFVSQLFHVPLRNSNKTNDGFTEKELYGILTTAFAFNFLDMDPVNSSELKAAAAEGISKLSAVVRDVCKAVKEDYFAATIRGFLRLCEKEHGLSGYGVHLIERLFQGGNSVDQVVSTILLNATAAVATQTQCFAQLLDLFLSDGYSSQWSEIRTLSQSDSPDTFEQLKKYVLEGCRFAPPAFRLLDWIDVDNATLQEGANTITVKKNDRTIVDFVTANMDPEKFPNPSEFKADRPEDSYISFGFGEHPYMRRSVALTAMASQLRVFGRLKGLRRAPGPQGVLKSKVINGAFKVYMKEDWSDWTPFPATMKVLFDEF